MTSGKGLIFHLKVTVLLIVCQSTMYSCCLFCWREVFREPGSSYDMSGICWQGRESSGEQALWIASASVILIPPTWSYPLKLKVSCRLFCQPRHLYYRATLWAGRWMQKTQLQTKKSDESACRAKCKPMCRSYRGHWFWLKKASGQPARWDDFLLRRTFVFHTLRYICLIDDSAQDAEDLVGLISLFLGQSAWLWDGDLATFLNKLVLHLISHWSDIQRVFE